MQYSYLPGVQVNTIDGGLAAARVPKTKKTLVLGTAGQGPASTAYQVIDRAKAAQDFGLDGSLIHSVEEVASYCDNIIAFRIGTKQASLNGIGIDETQGQVNNVGLSITFGQVDANTDLEYKLWYANGVLYVWLNDNLVYANDAVNQVYLDESDIMITGTATHGLAIGTGDVSSISVNNALTVRAAVGLAGTGNQPAPTYVAPVLGTGLTGRQTYIAVAQALDLLDVFAVEQVYCANALLDQPNVAYYVASDTTTAGNNPATNPNALDWLKVMVAPNGEKVYKWASETVDSSGSTKDGNGVSYTAATFTNAAARLAAGYNEVNFGYLLANFARNMEVNMGACMAFIGTYGPGGNNFNLRSTKNWVGFLPTYDSNGKPLTPGSGLLGIPCLVGTTSAKLHPACSDYAAGYRSDGFYATDNEQLDGGSLSDKNGNPIDVGAYLHVAADYAVMSNGWGVNYLGNIAGIVCGLRSNLDEKQSLTNQPLRVRQNWVPGLRQLDALTEAKINVLRFQDFNVFPRLLHFMTAANEASDYTQGMRMAIKGMLIQETRKIANDFIGQASNDGLLMTSMQTKLESRYSDLAKLGYITYANAVISTTPAQQRLGHANCSITFQPANELVQLDCDFAISRQ
jgi:hypothetical protein